MCAAVASSTREHLLLTAERLFATKGIESVSLRQIAREGGQKNVGAMQYHFGDRKGLFEAILEYRMVSVDAYRWEMLEAMELAGRGNEPRELVKCLVMPYLQHIRHEGNASHYIEFLARFQVGFPDHLHDINRNKPWQRCVHEIGMRLIDLMDDVPKRVGGRRLSFVGAMMVQAASDFERSMRAGKVGTDDLPLFAANLIDSLVGLLMAPVSEEARELMETPN